MLKDEDEVYCLTQKKKKKNKRCSPLFFIFDLVQCYCALCAVSIPSIVAMHRELGQLPFSTILKILFCSVS